MNFNFFKRSSPPLLLLKGLWREIGFINICHCISSWGRNLWFQKKEETGGISTPPLHTFPWMNYRIKCWRGLVVPCTFHILKTGGIISTPPFPHSTLWLKTGGIYLPPPSHIPHCGSKQIRMLSIDNYFAILSNFDIF